MWQTDIFTFRLGGKNAYLIGVAAPMAYFPLRGWRSSFFGVLQAQGRDTVQFYTQEKVVIERWPNE
jgi:malonate-semialdehyde dehydrogenase (acetylating)/methylmalonate-semialdehyde dehydrogenase